jgi:hypothetical protein
MRKRASWPLGLRLILRRVGLGQDALRKVEPLRELGDLGA